MYRTHFLCALITFALLLPNVSAQEITAQERLEQSIKFLSTLPAYSMDIAMDFALKATSGETNATQLTAHLDMAGTDRARFKVNVEEGAMELFFTEDARHIYLESQNQYVDGTAFGDRRKALTLMPGREYRPSQVLLSDLLHNDATLVEQAEDIQWIAQVEAGKDAPEQIRVTGAGLIVDLWIQQGDQPLIQKLAMDLTQMASQSNPTIASAVVTYNLSQWNLTPAFGDDHFNFTIPDGATEFQPARQRPADPLTGKPAPAFTLDLLDGEGTLDLAAHRGKNVVILDFWASWCGPCRVGLPIVSEVAGDFKDKGVVFYAVNVGEDKVKAQAFVEQTGLAATVALDTKGVAQRDYGASSIPMTVIIDKEGIVHEVHRGVSPSLKADLTRTLTELTE